MHPPGMWMNKMCTESVEVEFNEEKLSFKKGDMIYIPLVSVHMDPDYYDEPEKFNPDRFANGELKVLKDKGVFFPFSTGPRICVAMRFAIAQSKAAIATIVRHFEISVNAKTPKQFVVHPKAFINAPEGSYWINLKEL